MSISSKKRNGFFSFLKKLQYETPGWRDKSHAELMELVSPIWCSMAAEEKAKLNISYSCGSENGRAGLQRSFNTSMSSSSRGYDSYGRSLELLEEEARLKELRELEEKIDVKNFLQRAVKEGNLEQETFFLLHTNVFTVTDEGLVVPAEISVAKMSLRLGVETVFHAFIEPGPLPKGYRADCIENAEATHKIPLDLVFHDANYIDIYGSILNLLNTENSGSLAALYCLPKFRERNSLVLDWLKLKAGDSVGEGELHLYSLPGLLSQLAKAVPEGKVLRVPTVSIAEAQLERDTFIHWAGMDCQYHSEVETTHCTSGMVRRWAFTLCSLVCPALGIELLAGSHKPPHQGQAQSLREESELSISRDTQESEGEGLSEWVAKEQAKLGTHEDWEWEGLSWRGFSSCEESSIDM